MIIGINCLHLWFFSIEINTFCRPGASLTLKSIQFENFLLSTFLNYSHCQLLHNVIFKFYKIV